MIVSKKHSGNSGEDITNLREFPGKLPVEVQLPKEVPARRGFSIVYRGKTLLSQIDPVSQGERLTAGIPVKERTLYFCPSPLYGYGLPLFLEKLKNESQGKNSALLCAEADEKLLEISKKAVGALCASATESGFRQLALTKASSPEQICAYVRETWGERVFRRVEVIRLNGGCQLFPELYTDIKETLARELAVEWGNAMTLIRLGRLYIRNLIRNLALLPESENITALDFGSSPVLALGAGPSLDPLLDELTTLSGGNIPPPGRRRYKIICVDTCLPALHERAILPDLAVVLESQHWNLRDFSGARDREISAAFDLSALPASARVLGGKRCFFATPWTTLRLFRRLGEAGLEPETFFPMGSVGLCAAALALRISSGPVLAGGIDFSFSLDAYHARSTPAHSELQRKQNRFRSILNAGAAFRPGAFSALSKTGGAVRSDPAMRRYRDLFEQEFGGNPRLHDIAGSGLNLGVKTVSPAEAFSILNGAGETPAVRPLATDLPAARLPAASQSSAGSPAAWQKEKIAAFIRRETAALYELKEMLCGEIAANPGRMEELLDTSDYLWAHFPDCAGAGGRRPSCTDLGFLKRVRAETEPFIKLWEKSLGELV